MARQAALQEPREPVRKSLKERMAESDALWNETGHYHGIRELTLKEKDPIRYELFHSRLLSTVIAAREVLEEVLTGGTINTAVEFGGIDQYGRQTGGANAEVTASGSGARGVMDGIDAAWVLWNPEGDQGNAEMWELLYPHLYLGRRMLTDSPGAGKYRGGAAFESLWMIHNSDFVFTYQIPGVAKLASKFGIYGGYGGGPAYVHVAKHTDVFERIASRLPLPHGEGDPRMPDMKRLLVGEVLCGEDPHYISEPLKEGALYEKPYLPGGGGYGDPLDREPTRVERDVGLGFVSPWAAASLYGLVGKQTETEGEWKADAAETAERRAQMRRGRLARGGPVKEGWRGGRRGKPPGA